MLSMTQGFFAGRCLPRMLLAVSVTAVLKLLIKRLFRCPDFEGRGVEQTFLLLLLEKFLRC